MVGGRCFGTPDKSAELWPIHSAPFSSPGLLDHLISGGKCQSRIQIQGKELGTLAKRTQKNDCLASWVPLSLDCVRLERWRSAHLGRKGDHQTVPSGLEILLLLEDGTFMNVPGVKEENWVQGMTRRREGSLRALRQWWWPVCLSTTVPEIRHVSIWAKAPFLWAAFKWGLTKAKNPFSHFWYFRRSRVSEDWLDLHPIFGAFWHTSSPLHWTGFETKPLPFVQTSCRLHYIRRTQFWPAVFMVQLDLMRYWKKGVGEEIRRKS